MRHLDLFSGIGGFALAARRVGWETVGFCEIEPYCQRVLAKHWPDVPIYEDVRDLTSEQVGAADIITGGFPCQDISYAGKGAGIEGERSGLWTEIARLIGDIRPRYAVLENVSALLSRGLDRVAGDLAEIGYDCEWHCIPASAIGAPHRRDRVWIVAYPNGKPEQRSLNGCSREGTGKTTPAGTLHTCNESTRKPVADTMRPRGSIGLSGQDAGQEGQPRIAHYLSDEIGRARAEAGMDIWSVEPNVGRVANGIPRRVDRLRGLGNAIVPQVAEVIFRAIDNEHS